MIGHYELTIGFKCSEERGEESAADTDVHQLWQGVQSQLRGKVIEERVRVLPLVLLHQSDQVLQRTFSAPTLLQFHTAATGRHN